MDACANRKWQPRLGFFAANSILKISSETKVGLLISSINCTSPKHCYLHILENPISSRLCRLMCGKAPPFREIFSLFCGYATIFEAQPRRIWEKQSFGEAEPSPHIKRHSRKPRLNNLVWLCPKLVAIYRTRSGNRTAARRNTQFLLFRLFDCFE